MNWKYATGRQTVFGGDGYDNNLAGGDDRDDDIAKYTESMCSVNGGR